MADSDPKVKKSATTTVVSDPNMGEMYERLYPDTGCTESQKIERMERIIFKDDRSSGRRTGRNRGIIVPALPWQREE